MYMYIYIYIHAYIYIYVYIHPYNICGEVSAHLYGEEQSF